MSKQHVFRATVEWEPTGERFSRLPIADTKEAAEQKVKETLASERGGDKSRVIDVKREYDD